jgi:hypothetical protein
MESPFVAGNNWSFARSPFGGGNQVFNKIWFVRAMRTQSVNREFDRRDIAVWRA